MKTRFLSKPFLFLLTFAILGGALGLTIVTQAQTPEPESPADTPAQAAAPNAPSSLLFSYQGQLLDSGGNPVSGSVPMTFALYTSSTGGTACWTEAHSGSHAVDVQDGLFHVLLGQLTPLDTACLTGDIYLELTMNGETLSPREVMTSVFHAQEASTLPYGANVPGALTISTGWGDWLRLNQDAGGTWLIHNPESQDRILLGYHHADGTYKWDYFAITQDGNVGIGTTTPDHRLEVGGGNIEIQNDDADNYIRFHDPGNRWFTAGIRQSDGKFYINYGGSLGETTDGIVIQSDGNVGVGTTSPAEDLHVAAPNARVRVQSTASTNNAGLNFQTANGWIWEIGKRDTNNNFYISRFDGSGWNSRVEITADGDMHVDGNVTCGGLVENNLQTPEEKQAESIARFEEGDLLCWSPESEQLEKCTLPNDRLVMAVADPNGKPIVMGAEVIKVLGPVTAGDILVASDVPGYAMVNNDPAPGTVIAQALEDFDGERGIIKAMIRKW